MRLLLFLSFAAAAVAGPIGYVSDGYTLSTIDLSTGSVLSSVAQSDSRRINALAFGPQDTLYGIFDNQYLGVIDPLTGAVNILGFTIEVVRSLTFDTQGQLYLLGSTQIYYANAATGGITGGAACIAGGDSGWVVGAPATAWQSSGAGLVSYLFSGCDGSGSSGSGSNGSGSNGSGSDGSGTQGSGVSPSPFMASAFPPGSSLIAMHQGGNQIFGLLTQDGSFWLVSFDGSAFNPDPSLNLIGALPEGTTSLAVGAELAPEPASLWLLGLGLTGAAAYRRYR